MSTSVNPARSTGVAVFTGGWAVAQHWHFWVAPIAGGMIGAAVCRPIEGERPWHEQVGEIKSEYIDSDF